MTADLPTKTPATSTLASCASLKEATPDLFFEPLMKLDTLMGGGANEQAIMLCAKSLIELFPDLSGQQVLDAIRYGVKEVDWNGRMTFMALAKFIREHRKVENGVRLSDKMTLADANKYMRELRVKLGIQPGGLVETHLIPQEVRDAMQRG